MKNCKWIFGGYLWRLHYQSFDEFHAPQSEPEVRRAWWYLRHWPVYGNYCFRLLGLTLNGRPKK